MLGSCGKAGTWGKSVRVPSLAMRAAGKQKSFKLDGTQGERGTKDGPGRRNERQQKKPAAADPSNTTQYV